MSVQRAVSLAIRCPNDAALLLAVQRPRDDAELPGIWGLPAATLGPNETLGDAACRIGKQKLGIKVEIGRILACGDQQRPAYLLEMTLLEATLGNPSQQPRLVGPVQTRTVSAGSYTTYIGWRWAHPSLLAEAAQRESLCCQLLLTLESTTSGRTLP